MQSLENQPEIGEEDKNDSGFGKGPPLAQSLQGPGVMGKRLSAEGRRQGGGRRQAGALAGAAPATFLSRLVFTPRQHHEGLGSDVSETGIIEQEGGIELS